MRAYSAGMYNINFSRRGPHLFHFSLMDTYLTIKQSTEAQLTEKRSRFLAFTFPVKTEDEAKEKVAAFKKKYYDARHVCYAYVLGNDGKQTRANDDGEPSGTAGRPILGQIQSRQLTYTLGIVVRYFGGVKLGTGPLGVAYKTAIADALDEAEVEEKVITAIFRVAAPYADADTAMRFVREASAEMIQLDYTAEGCEITVEVRLDDEAALKKRLSKILSLKFLKDE